MAMVKKSLMFYGGWNVILCELWLLKHVTFLYDKATIDLMVSDSTIVLVVTITWVFTITPALIVARIAS